MPPYKEKETLRLFYSIGEVAKMFHVNASLIRFWEKEFDVIKPRKNKKGNRLFTQEDVDNLKTIYHLVKEKGYTLQGAKDKLKENRQAHRSSADVVDSLKKVREFLVLLKSEL